MQKNKIVTIQLIDTAIENLGDIIVVDFVNTKINLF